MTTSFSKVLKKRTCASTGAAPAGSRAAKLLSPYLRAWEGHDLDGFVALLKEDATPPPCHSWKTCGGLRLVPTAANRQPAFAVYSPAGPDGTWAAQ